MFHINIIDKVSSEPCGLTDEEVRQRFEEGKYNKKSGLKTKSIGRIAAENIFTLFNLINIVLFIFLICVGSNIKNMLFMGVIICNVGIGIFQEVRAKKTVDRLSIITSSKIKAFRQGKIAEIDINEIVLDDMIELSQGNQIPTDCVIISGECEVNESLLTGESDYIHKNPGDELFSGSFITSGKCLARAVRVGEDNYVSTVFSGAKYIKKLNSEIMTTLQKIIKIISFIIIPVGILLFHNQYFVSGVEFRPSVENAVAALIGMIPEGLVLLTSTVLAVSVIRLSKYNVLVQELYCIETLARVDVLCLDKTGTITEGCMEVTDVIPIDVPIEEINDALCAVVSALDDSNSTYLAIKEVFSAGSELIPIEKLPFSSDRKCSGVTFKGSGTYIMGAAEFILKNNTVKDKIEEYSSVSRVVVLAHSDNSIENDTLPENLVPIALICLRDKIRKEANDTLNYFRKQGVDLKIISGDNVKTVSGVAKAAGLKEYENFVDATTLKNEEDVKLAAEKYSIFGRVTPIQKKQLVMALKEKGHTVAMTGDGVNDVLALKEADCSVAMASGSDAARNVAQLVLVDSNFASMPKVVEEGRRSINNIQRSATLFLVKTIYACFLAILFVFIQMQYPFIPIQMTLISTFTIGIPSFILALEPNKDRISGKFFINVITRSLPGAITIIINVILIAIAGNIFALQASETSSLAVILTSFAGLMLIFKISYPFDLIRSALMVTMTVCITIGITVFSDLFEIAPFNSTLTVIMLILMAVSVIVFAISNFISDFVKNKRHPDKKSNPTA